MENKELFILYLSRHLTTLHVFACSFTAVADPDLQIRKAGGDHPYPEITGEAGLKKIFFQPFGPQFGLKLRRDPPLDPPL